MRHAASEPEKKLFPLKIILIFCIEEAFIKNNPDSINAPFRNSTAITLREILILKGQSNESFNLQFFFINTPVHWIAGKNIFDYG